MSSKSLLLLASLCCGLVSPLAAVENHWTGAGGDNLWSNPTNWSLARVPLGTDDVFIDLPGTYAVSLSDSNATAALFRLGAATGTQTLTLSNLTLTCADAAVLSNGVLNLVSGLPCTNLNVSGIVNWSSGFLGGPGKATIASGGFLNITSSALKTLVNCPLYNQGTINWNSTGHVSGGPLYNSGLFVVLSDWTLDQGAQVDGEFHNSGTVLVPAGTFSMVRMHYWTNSGSIIVGTNSGLDLRGYAAMTLLSGTTLAGDGGIGFNFPVTYASGTITNNTTVYIYNFSGSQTWTGSGRFLWNTISGPGTTTMAADCDVIWRNLPTLNNHILHNQGKVTWNPQGIDQNASTSGFFLNSGVIVFTNAYNWYIGCAFLNTGTLLWPTGTVFSQFNPGMPRWTNSGTFQVAADTLVLVYGDVTLLQGTTFAGAGKVVPVGDGSTVLAIGTMTNNGNVGVNSLFGSQTWTGPGVLIWGGGTWANGETTTIAPGSYLYFSPVGGDRTLDNHILYNQGTVAVSSSNPASLNGTGSNAVFANDGLFSIQSDFSCTGSGTFSNLAGGTLRTLTASTEIGWPFQNSGTLDLQSGELHFASNYVAASTSVHRITLGGYVPGTGFGYMSLSNFTPNGTLAVTVTNGFAPTNGSSFPLVNYTSHAGTFPAVQLPSLPKNLDWRLQYGSNALSLKVVPASTLNGAQRLSNGNFQFALNASAGSSFVIEASTNLLNWIALVTNSPFSGNANFTDTNASDFNKRFYRAFITP